jgi:hypothetical protein
VNVLQSVLVLKERKFDGVGPPGGGELRPAVSNVNIAYKIRVVRGAFAERDTRCNQIRRNCREAGGLY